jgi:hypothetical protein
LNFIFRLEKEFDLKMKLFIVLSVAIAIAVISCQAAPQVDSEYVTEDDIARRRINETLETVASLADDNKIALAVLKSIDQQCMLESYQRNQITTEVLFFEDMTEIENVDPYIAFANIALSCSSKLDGFLSFVFDNLFSFSGLLDTFREDDPFKKFIDDLICFNNYAVKTNFLNPEEYDHLKYELVNQTQEECDEYLKELQDGANGAVDLVSSFVISDHAYCLKTQLANEAEKFFLKYFLLIPLGLTEDQRKAKKLNFIADSREGLQKILSCNIEKTEADNKVAIE